MKTIFHPFLAGVFLSFTMLFLPDASVARPEKILTLGVLAYRPAPEVQAKWQPLADYLTAELPDIRVRMEVLNYAEFEDALKQNRLDFILTNPGHYVQLYRRYKLSGVLATLIENDNGIPLEYFGGAIFTRSGRSDINQLGDLRGKRIASVGAHSLGGYQAQALELLRAGLRPRKDITMLFTEMPHDTVVRAVLEGKADAGFARTGVIEAMAREGRLSPASLKILNSRPVSAFPHALSTRLYPEWPFVALPGRDTEISRHVTAALLRLEHDSAVTRRGGYWGFTIPADYSPVDELLRELRLPPYDKVPEFTVRDIWQRYRAALIILTLAVLTIGTLLVAIVFINRRLAGAREAAVRDLTERKKIEEERERLITELQHALAQIKTLHGMLPICAICKKIRNDQGTWQKLESYISERTDADFTHGICEDCAKKHYPRFSRNRGV